MKRILTMQDISCLGKCSLTEVLPIISAMGVECALLPTALLSTHTMFQGNTYLDLADQIRPITDHWEKEGAKFDAFYTGYLGKAEEIDLALELADRYRERGTKIIVDPVMGDHGRLYTGFDVDYVKENRRLCSAADVVIPNITEACLLTDSAYQEDYDEAYIRMLLRRLSDLGAGTAVLTGVSLAEGQTGIMGYEKNTKRFFSYQRKRLDTSYHGTGDIFAAVSVGGLMRGLGAEKAFALAADYTALTIERSMAHCREDRWGVCFEETLPWLIAQLNLAVEGDTH